MSYALFEGRPLTTKGRWINPLVFGLFSIEKGLPQIKKVSKPIFIIGTGRSGTTILGLVLSMHRHVGFLNEPKALWNSLYPYEDLIGSYSCDDARYYLGADDVTPHIRRGARRIYGAYLMLTGSERVVDKYPEIIFRIPFVRNIFPDAKFLFLSRNGWNTCTSINHWSKRHGEQGAAETHDWWGINNRKWKLLVEQVVPRHHDLHAKIEEIRNLTKHTDMAAVEWIVTMREGMRLLESKHDVMLVNYESLCERPRTVLSKIASFAGLENDEVFLKYGELTLRPTKASDPIDLHPAICDAFRSTMRELGYER